MKIENGELNIQVGNHHDWCSGILGEKGALRDTPMLPSLRTTPSEHVLTPMMAT